MKIKSSPARKSFLVVNYLLLTLVMCISLFPLIHVFALSLSSNSAAQAGWVTIFPVDFTLDSYQYILAKPEFFISFGVSLVRVVLGTLLSIGLTILCAYAMAQPDERFHARKYYVWVFLVTMVFSGGLIPLFIVVKSVGIYNSIWALILPGAVQTFNIILMLNFFRGLPYALTESALIDGASHFQIMTKIIVPVSKPSLATVGLFTMVNHWNSWFDALVYIRNEALYPIQMVIRNLLVASSSGDMMSNVNTYAKMTSESIKMASVVIAVLPILCVYPFLQKYFVHGMYTGAVKG